MSDSGWRHVFSQPLGRRLAWLCPALVAVAAIVSSVLFLDGRTHEWFLNHPDVWHKYAWVNGFRQLGKAYVVIWLLLLGSCLLDRWRATSVTLIALVLVALCVCPLKVAVRRPRPQLQAATLTQPLPVAPRPKTSFPSGDTAVAFAVATVLSTSLGRRWWPVFLAAAGAIGLLRVVVLAHYVSDVLAGAMIGVVCGFWALRLTVRWRQQDLFHMRTSSRAIAGLLLVLLTPPATRLVHAQALWIFLDVYGLPLLAFVLAYSAVVWFRVLSWASRKPAVQLPERPRRGDRPPRHVFSRGYERRVPGTGPAKTGASRLNTWDDR